MTTEQPVGVVTHYFGHLNMAAIRVDQGDLGVGDTIHVKGHTSDFSTRIDSMQVEHQPVIHVGPGVNVGIRVPYHAHEHDRVYKVA